MKAKHNLNSIIKMLDDHGVDLNRMSDKDLSGIDRVCNQLECIIWLTDHRRVKPVFINEFGRKFYGIDNSKDVLEEVSYEDMLHPDHFSDLHKRIVFFTENPKEVHEMTYYIKCADGEYRWTFSEARGVSFDFAGRPTFVLAAAYDIDACLTNRKISAKPANYTDIVMRNELLTAREKEILNLIANELTSQEIAKRLFIEPTTVDSHRKHIIKKLGVKSSMGLVRYALLYMPY